MRLDPYRPAERLHRMTDKVALRFVADPARSHRPKFCGLDALYNDSVTQPLSQRDDALDDGVDAIVCHRISNQGMVDFEHVESQVIQLRQIAVASAEVVDCNGNTQMCQLLQHATSGIDIVRKRAFGDLELNVAT